MSSMVKNKRKKEKRKNNMKRKINIKTGIYILLLVLWLSPLYGQEIERQPFNSPTPVTIQHELKAPGVGGPDIPPPTEEDKVGGVPVKDTFWLFPLLAASYGLYTGRKKRIVKSEK